VESRSLPVFAAVLAVEAGSRYDPDGKWGLSSVTSSLLLEGSEALPEDVMARRLDSLGASLEVTCAYETSSLTLVGLSENLPEVLGSGVETMGALVREYLFVSLFKACAESLASENVSRLAAMQRADKNIGELLEDLNGRFHRVRQSGIDEELFDVIAGFEALASGREPSGAKRPGRVISSASRAVPPRSCSSRSRPGTSHNSRWPVPCPRRS